MDELVRQAIIRSQNLEMHAQETHVREDMQDSHTDITDNHEPALVSETENVDLPEPISSLESQEIAQEEPAQDGPQSPSEHEEHDGENDIQGTDMTDVDADLKDEIVREKIRSHSSVLSNGMYLLWTGELYCDCILVIEDKELKCHSCVIASFSPLLRIKLNSLQCKTRLEGSKLFIVVDLSEVMTYTDLEPLVRYMYTGELRFKRLRVYDILKGAQFLGLKEIQQFCFIWMAQNVTVKPLPESLKLNNSDCGNEEEQVNSTQSTLNSTVNAASEVNGKADDVDFQDYIDILNSWQRAATEDPPSNIGSDAIGHSINMLKDNAGGARLLNSLQLQNKDPSLLSLEARPSDETQDPVGGTEPQDNTVGVRRRTARKQPLRFNAGEIRDRSDTFKPLDLLYVNFNNQKYIGTDDSGKVKKQERIVVVLPSAAGDARVEKLLKMQPPKRIKRKYKKRAVKLEVIEDDEDLIEDDDDVDNNEDDGEDNKGKIRKRRSKRKIKKKKYATQQVTLEVTGDSFTCVRAPDETGHSSYKCPECGRCFKKLTMMTEHLGNHKNNELSMCQICGHGFVRLCDLSRHTRLHTGHKCRHCPFTSRSPKKFAIHCEKEHQILKAFVCPHEGCTFATNRGHQLENHKVIHTSLKPYKCIHCGKSFAHRSGLNSHIRSCLQKRDRICDVCGKAFNHLGSLKSHRRVHFGDKPYMCPDCPSRFSDHRNLKRHLTVHQKGGRMFTSPTKQSPASMVDSRGNVHQPSMVDSRGNVQQPSMVDSRGNVQQPSMVDSRGNVQQPSMVDSRGNVHQPSMVDSRGNVHQSSMVDSRGNVHQPSMPSKKSMNPKFPKVLDAAEIQQYQAQHQNLKRTENGPPELIQTQYPHPQIASFQPIPRKLPPAPPPLVSESMRLHEYQPSISMAHSQPPMTSGYNAACLAPFSPLVAPEFYNTGLISTGHLDVHAHHPSITQSGGIPISSYQQLHDYTMANVWKTAHEELNPALHSHQGHAGNHPGHASNHHGHAGN